MVLPREDGKWVVTGDGTPSETTVYETFPQALEEGRALARRENLRLRVLHLPRDTTGEPNGWGKSPSTR